MAVDNSLESLLATLTTSIQAATEALPGDKVVPPADGISLLDVKNELLLSYLQNLVFLILLKIRARSGAPAQRKADDPNLHDEVVKKLVELRIYLEKGVRPLENRLKYQINRITRAAEDATRKSSVATKGPKGKPSGAGAGSGSDASDAGSNEAESATEDEDEQITYAPRANFSRDKSKGTSAAAAAASKDGIYRPPRIAPVSMPTTQGREERQDRRPLRSATMDEHIAEEVSTAPLAQPSIGSNVVDGGRRTKSERERKEENERREYEESNFVRLPPKSKKELRKQRSRGGGFGGEEWRDISAGADRIERLTQKKSGGGGSLGSLEKSRKRPVEDGPRSSGSAIGDAFEKRRRVVSRYR